MARLFCEKLVPAEPLLAPLFADMPPGHPEQVAAAGRGIRSGRVRIPRINVGSRAGSATGSRKSTYQCMPLQNGLFRECPHRRSASCSRDAPALRAASLPPVPVSSNPPVTR
jgi:hypothetical protein